MGEFDDFVRLIDRRTQTAQVKAVVWATVKEVDWDKKDMTATSISDGLDYYEVPLGVGTFYRRPVVGSKVLLGILEGKKAAAVLLDAEDVEELVYTSGESVFTIKKEGYIIKQGNESLRDCLNDFIDECNKIIVVNGTSINVPAVEAIKERLNTILVG